MFWSTNDIPIALIRGASLGALRNGRYARRSMLALMVAVISMMIGRARSVTTRASVLDAGMPNPCTISSVAK
jgi:hypothetical protein